MLLGGENPCLDLPSHHVSKKGVGTKLRYILSPPHFILGRGGLGPPNAFITRQSVPDSMVRHNKLLKAPKPHFTKPYFFWDTL